MRRSSRDRPRGARGPRAGQPGRARGPHGRQDPRVGRSGAIQPFEGETCLFIRPPFEFHASDALLTNFHLPRSTLLALVAAFAGLELVMDVYREAVDEGYRFYSYGDACYFY